MLEVLTSSKSHLMDIKVDGAGIQDILVQRIDDLMKDKRNSYLQQSLCNYVITLDWVSRYTYSYCVGDDVRNI
jgi:hypothetical protein